MCALLYSVHGLPFRAAAGLACPYGKARPGQGRLQLCLPFPSIGRQQPCWAAFSIPAGMLGSSRAAERGKGRRCNAGSMRRPRNGIQRYRLRTLKATALPAAARQAARQGTAAILLLASSSY